MVNRVWLFLSIKEFFLVMWTKTWNNTSKLKTVGGRLCLVILITHQQWLTLGQCICAVTIVQFCVSAAHLIVDAIRFQAVYMIGHQVSLCALSKLYSHRCSKNRLSSGNSYLDWSRFNQDSKHIGKGIHLWILLLEQNWSCNCNTWGPLFLTWQLHVIRKEEKIGALFFHSSQSDSKSNLTRSHFLKRDGFDLEHRPQTSLETAIGEHSAARALHDSLCNSFRRTIHEGFAVV